MRKLLIISTTSLLLLTACKRPGHGGMPTPTPDNGMRIEGTSPSSVHEDSTPAPEEAPTPLALDEAGLKKWIEFRREMIKFVAAEQKKIAAAGQQTNDMSKIKALADVNAEIDKGSKELRAKYGFTEKSDNDINDAVMNVTGADMSHNAVMAGPLAEMRKNAAGSGPEAETAKAGIAQIQAQEKEQLAKVRKDYGDKAVDTILAHSAELSQMTKDAMSAAFGGGN